jgi:hypothetical protein
MVQPVSPVHHHRALPAANDANDPRHHSCHCDRPAAQNQQNDQQA